jgi:tryptophan 2,3-dioxygenase
MDPFQMPGTETLADALAAEAHTDFTDKMSYGDYLQLDRLLSAQKPMTHEHDEILFIIIHQAAELWMKLVLHELQAARELIRHDDLQPAFKGMARVGRIQGQLIQSWDVLSTLTPADYLRFRGKLGQASGFQSVQYRLIEFVLGNKQEHMIDPHRHRDELRRRLEHALATSSLYDEAIQLLSRRGFAIDPAVLNRDVRYPHRLHPSVTAAWLKVYQDSNAFWDLYELAEELVDLEDSFQQWRFRHVTTVQRIIGCKPGTGGTIGVGYLKKALEIVFFPELWEVRTAL